MSSIDYGRDAPYWRVSFSLAGEIEDGSGKSLEDAVAGLVVNLRRSSERHSRVADQISTELERYSSRLRESAS